MFERFVMDFEKTFEKESEETYKYFQKLYPHFSIVENKTVLEIGPLHGFHTKLIEHYNPKKITLVEPSLAFNRLKKIYPNYELICDDIFNVLIDKRKFDVVICFGVLYHLHHPFSLLEHIVNNCDPDHVLLETTTGGQNPSLSDFSAASVDIEYDGELGNRQLINNWKSVNLRVLVSQQAIDYAMDQLDYKCNLNINYLNEFPNTMCGSKNISWLTGWERK